MTEQTKTAAAALVMQIEGVRLSAYRDSGGVWTIGVGHTKGVFEGQSVTLAQAMSFLKDDLAPLFSLIDAKASLTPCQCIAYTSFGFNCGAGALSRVLVGTDRVDNPRHTRDAKGVVLPGLMSRRNLELALLAC